MLNGYNIKNSLYARSMDYAMVCQLRPYPSVVRFETIEETKVVSSHAMFLWKTKIRDQGKGKEPVTEGDTQMLPSVRSTPSKRWLQTLRKFRRMHKVLEVVQGEYA